jgi:ketosteroid isomerase-like protein
MRRITLGLLAALALGSEVVHAQSRVDVDTSALSHADAELGAVRTAYAAAASTGDATGLSALYAPDAIALLDGGALLRGAGEIVKRHEASGGATLTLAPRELRRAGTIASEVGTFSEAADRGATPVSGVYVTIYTRGTDGVWRIAMEVRARGREQQLAAR